MAARAITPGGPGYPSRLAALASPPDPLWVRGAVPEGPALAVVGARAARRASLELARSVAAAVRGVTIVSGGALGVDGAAHEGALEAGGATVAVLGCGIDVVYPARHAGLFAAIPSQGALVSQFVPSQAPQRGQFPTRNTLIAALADWVLVVQAAERSGSLHTARAARRLGRRLAAVPGSPGCDRLIAEGARAVAGAEDVLAALSGDASPAPWGLPADPLARRLYSVLDHVARDVGDLAQRAGIPVQACAAAAVDLEMDGLAARAASGRYLRLR